MARAEKAAAVAKDTGKQGISLLGGLV